MSHYGEDLRTSTRHRPAVPGGGASDLDEDEGSTDPSKMDH